MIGRVVKHYKILERLGRGGMGVVYKAEDLKLGRKVALKFLPPHVSPSVETNQRFLQEARAASALDHPNACTIHEIDETQDGQLFIVMAFYDGETLAAKLKHGPMAPSQAVGYALQTARGLGRAHQLGIVHRDVKPANLMVTKDDIVKVLDFGIAKLVGASPVTHAGKVVGSVEYMAPEHARGEDVDPRADLWSLGVVLYEALAGRKPFRSEHPQAALYAILNLNPKPLGEVAPQTPARLQSIVGKALEKAPEHRYQSAEEIIRDLEEPEDWTPATSVISAAKTHPQGSIAVLPFQDMSAEKDQEYFCDGIAEELISALSRVEGLRVASRTSVRQAVGDDTPDLRLLRERLGVGTLLEGGVRKSGTRLRITVRLVSVVDGYELWSERFDRELEDVFAIQEEIAQKVVETLRPRLLGGTAGPLVSAARGFEVYNLYLKGRYYWNQRSESGLRKSVELFRQAIERDPTYSKPYAGLADANLLLGVYGLSAPDEVMPKARDAAERALAIDNQSAEVFSSLACLEAVYEWDWEASEEHFRRALAIDPNYATAHHWYAVNVLAPTGRFEEAAVELRQAEDRDPLSLAIHASSGLLLYYWRRYEPAIAELTRTLELDPRFAVAHFFLGQALTQLGRHKEAIAELEAAVRLSGGAAEMRAALAYGNALAGNTDAALRILRELEAAAAHRYVSPVLMAQIHSGLGDLGLAIEGLEKASRWRAADLLWIGVRPTFDPLRKEPAFTALLDQLHLPNVDPKTAVGDTAEGAELDPTRFL